jgi:hypothetical protein
MINMTADDDWKVRKASIEFQDKYQSDLSGKGYVSYGGGSDPNITVHTNEVEEIKKKLPKNFSGYPVRVVLMTKPN